MIDSCLYVLASVAKDEDSRGQVEVILSAPRLVDLVFEILDWRRLLQNANLDPRCEAAWTCSSIAENGPKQADFLSTESNCFH
ncbi:hypothetical protein KIN20_033775 [Parelaphostrongylus tenuis]|uniref:Uncharacterized protein n=1 Tax=Parelaphostrongylus tenuis TaxID=148309 RepID=A0AAD5R8L8_PARTN|nr:hypothetical protein KIN20_033775 [Parelaphostrongylus tenuis]